MMNREKQFHRRVFRRILLKEAAVSGLHWVLIAMLVAVVGFARYEAPHEPKAGEPVVGEQPQEVEDVFVPEPGDFLVESFVEDLEVPWDLDFLPDGRALVTERPGRVRLIVNERLTDEPYAVVDTAAIGEGGLMGLAVHPDYPGKPYVYIMYTYRVGTDLFNKVVRLRDTGSAAKQDKIIVERIPGHRVHDGGRIAFGPDRMLYVCTGDVGQAGIAQDIRNLGGKILRFTPEGAIPPDNPFRDSPVYSYGHRNPQGLAWHPDTGELFSSEHGPSGEFGLFGHDSINVIRRGRNSGWPLVLGAVNMHPYVDPVVFWPKATPPAGMAFSRGDLYVASLRGEALIRISFRHRGGTYEAGSIQRLFATDWYRGEYGRLRHITAGPDGNLYMLTSNRDGRGTPRKGDDKILRLRYRR
ncbi:MAG: PQQ-dependent sugar dehydrogenase [Desulfomonilia bacterium]|nr:PQQ-dependent sugar dehydrogenase [Deltaproteobacteria bacterium]